MNRIVISAIVLAAMGSVFPIHADENAKETWIYNHILRVAGTEADISCVEKIVSMCDESGNKLKALFQDALGLEEQSVFNRLPIRLHIERDNRSAGLFADYGDTVAARTFHIDHFEAIFDFQCPAHVPTRNLSTPKWAPSLCSVFAHEVAETAHVFRTEATTKCARWRSHLVGIAAENRFRGAATNQSIACRSVEPWGQATLRHGVHEDTFLQYGANYLVIHAASNNKTIEYTTGDNATCVEKEWDWRILEPKIKYPLGLEACSNP